MKAAAVRHLNDIVSLVVLTLMTAALIAGQVEAAGHPVDVSSADSFKVVVEVRVSKEYGD